MRDEGKIGSIAELRRAVKASRSSKKTLRHFVPDPLAFTRCYNKGLEDALKLIDEFEAGLRERIKHLENFYCEENAADELRRVLGDKTPLNLWKCENCGVEVPCGELLCKKCLGEGGEK